MVAEGQQGGRVVLDRVQAAVQVDEPGAARLLARRGAQWHRSKVAAIEAGERPNMSFADVLVLANAFNVELAELFDGDGEVTLTEYVTLSRPMVRDVIRGTYVVGGSEDWDPTTRRGELLELARIRADDDARKAASLLGSEADRALADRLNVPARAVTETATELWSRTLTEERDARAAGLGDMSAGERQARRGHITRELSRQLQAELDRRGLITESPEEEKEDE